MKEKTYLFNLTLRGKGESVEDAWEDAVEAFINDPGNAENYELEKEDN